MSATAAGFGQRRRGAGSLPMAALVCAIFGSLAGWTCAAAAAEGVARPVPAGFAFDGAVSEWGGEAPTLPLLAKAPGARDGHVWVGQEASGLVVAGTVDGAPPRFARTPAEMANADHLELWVALVHPVPMPPVGWGNQFGPQTLASAADCDSQDAFANDPAAASECKSWFATQTRWRSKLIRQFARQWQLAPDTALEVWAQPALQAMSLQEREAAVPLPPAADTPAGGVRTAFAANPGGRGYSFEIRVPWAALPASGTLAIDRVRLMLDVFSPGSGGRYGAFSSTSANRRFAAIETLDRIALDPPKRFRLGSCSQPLDLDDFWQETRLAGYYMPAASAEIGALFALGNPVAGYRYEPGGVSPEVVVQRLFARPLGPSVMVCGPELSVRRGESMMFSPAIELRENFRSAPVDGGWLIANGPVTGIASRLGTGACGACPLVRLDVLFVPEAAGEASTIYSGSWLVEDEDPGSGLRNARVSLADDLQTIHLWEAEPDGSDAGAPWTYHRFCYEPQAHSYRQCEERPESPPPGDLALPPAE